VNEYRSEVGLSVVAGACAEVAAMGEKREGVETAGVGACAHVDEEEACEPNKKPADAAGAATAGATAGANAGVGAASVASRPYDAASEGKRVVAGAGAGAVPLPPTTPTVVAPTKVQAGVVDAAAGAVAVCLAPKMNVEGAEPVAAPKMLGGGL
jgi:hypothetical protein